MAIMRHGPWQVHGPHFQHDIRNAFDRFFSAEEAGQPNAAARQWTPRVDITEEPTRFAIIADIPGVDPKDIEITMEKGILSIKGERKSEATAENGKLTRTERSHGAFHRRFALPDVADADGIKANGKNGVLEISIPKRPETTARRINVN
jgi:HSP20 family protein